MASIPEFNRQLSALVSLTDKNVEAHHLLVLLAVAESGPRGIHGTDLAKKFEMTPKSAMSRALQRLMAGSPTQANVGKGLGLVQDRRDASTLDGTSTACRHLPSRS